VVYLGTSVYPGGYRGQVATWSEFRKRKAPRREVPGLFLTRERSTLKHELPQQQAEDLQSKAQGVALTSFHVRATY